MKQEKIKNILICAGGTAGHVFPAIEVAKEFDYRGYLVYFITDYRMYKFINKHPYFANKNIKLFCFSGRGLNKKTIIQDFISCIFLTFGLIQSLINIAFIRPTIAIGFGGYITVPVLFSCHLYRVNIFIHEGNAVLGRANKLLYKISKKLMTNFSKLIKNDDNKINYLCVGMPIRDDIINLNKLNYTKECSDTINILITGGSLGSEIMDEKVVQAIISLPLALKQKIMIVQQVRKEKFDELKKTYAENDINAELKIFIMDMAKQLKWASFVICRCGAGTLAENLITGKPALMIPLANSADNHQFYNAQVLEKKGLGRIITEYELLDTIKLKNRLEDMIKNIDKYKKASESIKKNVILDSAVRIADITSSAILSKKRKD